MKSVLWAVSFIKDEMYSHILNKRQSHRDVQSVEKHLFCKDSYSLIIKFLLWLDVLSKEVILNAATLI